MMQILRDEQRRRNMLYPAGESARVCNCCGASAESDPILYDGAIFCSAECIEYVQEQEQEYLDSYDVWEDE